MSTWHPTWPIIRTFPATDLDRIAMPLGGIGTGNFNLGGRGDFRDFSVVNRPAQGWTPEGAMAVVWCRTPAGATIARCCEGPLPDHLIEGDSGARAANHGMPRFANAEFAHAYPFGQVQLQDPAVPLSVRLEAWNPLIPGDSSASGRPVAVLRYVLRNPTTTPLDATLALTIPNFVGMDGSTGKTSGNRNCLRTAPGLRGFLLDAEGVPTDAETWGSLALATTHTGPLSWRSAWTPGHWNADYLGWWDDLLADGRLDDEPGSGEQPRCSLAASTTVPAGGEVAITFLVGWHFPQRQTWSGTPWSGWHPPAADGWLRVPPERLIGNWYCTRQADAWAGLVDVAAQLPELEQRSCAWVRTMVDSSLPRVVVEAALANLSTLRTQTCFRLPDGTLCGWEGIMDRAGSCFGSCTHVWNYEQAVAHLFPDLAQSMRRVEFNQCTLPDGHMNFRAELPFSRCAERSLAAADGQLGCLLKLHRDWKLAGDDRFLHELWPAARRALEFCWLSGGWDADGDGVMEGCQHNTMDVEYYGPNPQMQLWYLAALRAAAELAERQGEADFSVHCLRLAAQGAEYLDRQLWNGEYYEQRIMPPTAPIRAGLRHGGMGAQDLSAPDFQIGTGCLVDQLVGQVAAYVSGLGTLADSQHIRESGRAVLRLNRCSDFNGHFNHMRSFATNGDTALLMATWPRGERPRKPFPYSHEVMTGFEYVAAAAVIWQGDDAAGVQVVADIRARYDGRRRNPFDEAECGHHYARALASWGILLALTGFGYDAARGMLTLRDQHGTWFWAVGAAWGTVTISADTVALAVGAGTPHLTRLRIGSVELSCVPGVAAQSWVRVNA